MFKRALGAAVLASTAMSAGAATSGSVLVVGATVLNVCVISDSVMLFGNLGMVTNALGVTSTPVGDATATVPVICTTGTSSTVEAGLGLNASGAERRMKHLLSSSYLPYTLYKDSGRTQVFGTGSDALTYAGTGLLGSFTIYGRITGANINAALPGVYADSVALTLTYTP